MNNEQVHAAIRLFELCEQQKPELFIAIKHLANIFGNMELAYLDRLREDDLLYFENGKICFRRLVFRDGDTDCIGDEYPIGYLYTADSILIERKEAADAKKKQERLELNKSIIQNNIKEKQRELAYLQNRLSEMEESDGNKKTLLN